MALATDSKGRFCFTFTLPSIVETATATCNTAGSITVKQGGSQTWGIVVKDANGNIKGQGCFKGADFILNNLTTGDYTVEYADADGHTAVKTVNVDGVNSLTASYQISNVTSAINQPVNFTSVVNALASYTWDFGDGSTSTDANPTILTANRELIMLCCLL